MRSMNVAALAVALVLGAWAPAGRAQAPRTLDLAQAWAAALAQDASLRASRSGAQAVREAVPQARARLLPQVAATAGRSRNQLDETSVGLLGTPVSREQDYYAGNVALTVRQPLYRPMERANLRQAEARVEEGEARLQADVQQLAVRLCQGYFEVLLAREQAELVRVQQIALRAQLQAATRAVQAGSGTRTDIDEVQARLDASVADELQARQSGELALRQLRTMVTEPFDAIAPLDPAALPLTAPAPGEIADWLARAEAGSPEMRAALARLDAARLEVEKARAGHRPTLDAVADVSRSQSDNINRIGSEYGSRSVGLQLSIPLYAGGAVSSAVRQALAEEQRARDTLEALRQDLAVRVHREFAGVAEGVLRIRALEQSVRSSDLAVASNSRSFEAGARTSVDVLNAQQQLAAARHELARARYVYLMSRVRLDVLAGTFDEGRLAALNAFFPTAGAGAPIPHPPQEQKP